MPRSRPETFDAATKHLFRHLRDWKELQWNPVAQHFFAVSGLRGPTVGANKALARLHYAIKNIAEDLGRESGVAQGREHALLQFEIVRRQYFEGCKIDVIARDLNLSVQHCYRERARVCKQIALRLSKVEQPLSVVTSSDDAFYILLNNLIESKETARQDRLRALDYLEGIVTSPLHRMSALHASAELAISVGDQARAEIAFDRASKLDADLLEMSPDLQAMAETSRYIARSSLADYRGDVDAAFAMASFAKTFADRMRFPSMRHAHVQYATAHRNWAIAAWNRGDQYLAYEDLAMVVARSEQVRVSNVISLKLQTTLWKFRTYLVATKTSNYASQSRIDGLMTAFLRAREAGLLIEALEALTTIVECHVFAGRDKQALESGRSAIALSKEVADPVVETELLIGIGTRLLSTRFWREGLKLIPALNGSIKISAYYRNLRDYGAALAALRTGRFEDARHWSSAVDYSNRLVGLEIRRLVVEGLAARGLGEARVSEEAAEAAVGLAERLGSAPLMSEAFTLATAVFGERQFGSRARELARILSA